MDKFAIINKNTIELSDKEMEGAANFHKRRIAFAFVDGQCRFNDNLDDDRDHQHWVCEDYGLTKDEFENLIRGYMLPGKIVLYQSSHFLEVDLSKLSVEDLLILLHTYKKTYKEELATIYNGVKIGVVGEEWSGKSEVLKTVFERSV